MSENDRAGFQILLFGVLLGAMIYVVPMVVAFANGHPHRMGIALVNLLFGWSLIGYVAALIWACCRPRPAQSLVQQVVAPPPVPSSPPRLEAELEALQRLVDRGLISTEESERRRQKLLDVIH